MARWTTSRKVVVGCVCGFVALAAAVTVAYAMYFAHRALPNTVVGHTDVSGQSEAQLRQSLTDAATATTLSITINGEQQQATLGDLGYSLNMDDTLKQILAPNSSPTHRVTALFGHKNIAPVFTHDENTLSTYASGLTDKYGTAPVNSTVTLDGTTFTATADTPGKGIDADSLTSAAASMASSLKPASLDLGVVDLPATITKAAAQSVADKANAMVATSVVINDGKADHSPTPADIASWITITTGDDSMPVATVDAAKVTAWLQPVADSLTVKAVNGVHNVDATGAVVSTPTQGVDGRTVNNVDALSADIVKAVQSATAYNGTFEYDTTKATYTNKQVVQVPGVTAYQPAADEKWIDVNLSTFKVTAYVGSQVVYGPVTVSIGKKTSPTVTGIYHIYLKYAVQDMKVTQPDGSIEDVPNVKWVSYFYNGYALHAAWWLTSPSQWGNYQSHGCVNMHDADAQWIFNWAPIGTTVVSHY